MTKLPFLFLLFSLSALPLEVISQPPDSEKSVLLTVQRRWGNPTAIASWNSSETPCEWPEIQCSGDNSSVTGIFLRDMGISTEIPPEICELKNLSSLDLALNFIPGEFPGVLYRCRSLEVLDLSQNLLVGAIPEDIDKLSSSLHKLDLSGNNFSGSIPRSIGKIADLRELNLHMNLFNGTLPAEIGDLSKLELLRLAYNGFLAPAPIQPEIGKLGNLKELWMAEMNLAGKIPESFFGLESLEKLDLSMNKLEGQIPEGVFNLTSLRILLLYHNKLSGEIPSRVGAMRLSEIDLAMNDLTGFIPMDFGKLRNLTLLNLYSNRLTGDIPASLGLVPSLRIFRAFKNKLTGALPPELGKNTMLESLEVSENELSGKVPESLCFNRALKGLVLFSNKLAGELSAKLGDCDSLETVQLYRNNFSGDIPDGMWRTTSNLSTLMISDNSFSGRLPNKLPMNMSRLEISNNRFSGGFPRGSLSSWDNLVVFKAGGNLFSGEIPIGLTSLSRLTTLLLDGNKFSGELPPEITSWKSLDTLNLSRNQLSGNIPKSIGSLPHLLYLDLSKNHFSGEIPSELSRPRLNSLDLSSNNLSGEIPSELDNPAFQDSFGKNPDLCSDSNPPAVHLRTCSADLQRVPTKVPAKRPSRAILVGIVTLVAVTFAATLALAITLSALRRRHVERVESATWKVTSFQREEFTEYKAILEGLTDVNSIGRGGAGLVYRVGTDRAGEFVAVKKIRMNGSDQESGSGLERQFWAEVRALGTMRHSNVVKLLCCVSGERAKLLVYEYMENRSLDLWLHKSMRDHPGGGPRLEWPVRLGIGIGAAQGLSYMHHDCSPPVLHRDVKTSNILLDSEFRPKIADFGLARVLVARGRPHTVSAIAGSYGYIAPEYAYMSKVDEKIDVYSFGVVLLELATGREASFEDTSLVDWAWKHHKDEKPVSEALDEEIVRPCHLEEMTTVFKLGLMCTSTSPSARPSMKEVLQVLKRSDGYADKRVGSEFDVAPLLGDTKYLASYKRKKVSEVVDDDDSFFSDSNSS